MKCINSPTKVKSKKIHPFPPWATQRDNPQSFASYRFFPLWWVLNPRRLLANCRIEEKFAFDSASPVDIIRTTFYKLQICDTFELYWKYFNSEISDCPMMIASSAKMVQFDAKLVSQFSINDEVTQTTPNYKICILPSGDRPFTLPVVNQQHNRCFLLECTWLKLSPDIGSFLSTAVSLQPMESLVLFYCSKKALLFTRFPDAKRLSSTQK